MTTTTTTISKSVTDDLRSRLAAIEGHQTELLAERDEISYLALVDRDKKAVDRLNAINGEIERLKTQASSIEPALREATKRESAAREEAAAEKRRSDARQADVVLAEAEKIALKFDEALKAVSEHAIAFETAMINVRQLTGTSPRYDAIRVFMFRAVRSALHRTPVHIDAISVAEQTTLSAASTSWSRSIRGWIAGVINNNAAKAA
jgi:hypothetical protein